MKQIDGQLALFEEDQRTLLLRDELTKARFPDGKLRIEEFFMQNKPTDAELADFLRQQYGIGGTAGPGMPFVDYDTKGIRIRTREPKQDFRYTWSEVAKMVRKCFYEDSYVTSADVKDMVYHYIFYLSEGWDVDWCMDHLRKLLNHPKLSMADKSRLKEVITWESQS